MHRKNSAQLCFLLLGLWLFSACDFGSANDLNDAGVASAPKTLSEADLLDPKNANSATSNITRSGLRACMLTPPPIRFSWP